MKDGSFGYGTRVGKSTLTDKTVSTASYDSSHTLADDGQASDGKLTSKSEVTTNYSYTSTNKSLPIPSSPLPDTTYVDVTETINNSRNTTNTSEEKGSYSDYSFTRLAYGTYTEEFKTNSFTGSLLKTDTKKWASDGENTFTDRTDLLVDIKSQKRKLAGTYSPSGGSENVEQDQRQTNTLSSQYGNTLETREGSDVSTKTTWNTTTHSYVNVSLDKASGTTTYDETRTEVSQPGNQTFTYPAIHTVTDPFANSAPPKQSGPRDTGSSGGGVFEFAVDGSLLLDGSPLLPTYDFLPDPNDPLRRTREEARRASELSQEDFSAYMKGISEPELVSIETLGGIGLGGAAREYYGSGTVLGITFGFLGDLLGPAKPGKIKTYSDGTRIYELANPSTGQLANQALTLAPGLKAGNKGPKGFFAKPKARAPEVVDAPPASRPGSISGNPANRLIETGTPLKNGEGWARRWIRMTEADELAQRQAIFDHYNDVLDEVARRGLTGDAARNFSLEEMRRFRTDWLKDFLENREY